MKFLVLQTLQVHTIKNERTSLLPFSLPFFPFILPFPFFPFSLPFLLPFLSPFRPHSLPFVHTLSLPSLSIHRFYSSSLLFRSSPLPLRTCVLHSSIIYSHPLCTISIGKADAKSKQARAMDLTPKPVHRQN